MSHLQNALMYFSCQRAMGRSHSKSCCLRNEIISEVVHCPFRADPRTNLFHLLFLLVGGRWVGQDERDATVPSTSSSSFSLFWIFTSVEQPQGDEPSFTIALPLFAVKDHRSLCTASPSPSLCPLSLTPCSLPASLLPFSSSPSLGLCAGLPSLWLSSLPSFLSSSANSSLVPGQ